MENNNNFFNLQKLGQDTYGYVELPEVTKELPVEDWLMKTYKLTKEEAEAAAFQANLNYIAKTGDTSTLPEGYKIDHIPGTRLILTGYGGLTRIANPTSIIGPDGKVVASYDPIKNVKFNTLDPADNVANDLIFDIFTLGAGAANGALKTTGKAAYKLGLKGTQAFFKYTVPSTYIKPLASRLFKASPYTSRLAGLWGDNLLFSTLGGLAANNFVQNPNLETGGYAALGLAPYVSMMYRPFINSKFVQGVKNLKLAQGLHATDVGRGRSFHDLLELYSYLKYPTKITSEPTLTKHLLGDEAIRMFKEYGGEPLPENSKIGELLRKYVPEARERYGIVNRPEITDEEIAQALYKLIISLENLTMNPYYSTEEPLLGFRGDTQRYTELKTRPTPDELVKSGGTMDNSLGNLFLGELPEAERGVGVDRYVVTLNPESSETSGLWQVNTEPSATGAGSVNIPKTISYTGEGYPPLFNEYSSYTLTPHFINDRGYFWAPKIKVKPQYTTSGVNDINGFMFKGKPRDASFEIEVGESGRAAEQKYGFKLHTAEKPVANPDDPKGVTLIWNGKELNLVDDAGVEHGAARDLMAEHYTNLLNDALQNNLGVLVSAPMPISSNGAHPFRGEHGRYTYIALPNFNINGAKHLLPYDLRIPRDWNDKNIYRVLFPAGLTFMGLNNTQDAEEPKIQ